MLANFPPSLTLVLKSEGGYVNNRFDPGGATNFGITQRVYNAYRALITQPVQSVRYIAMTEVDAIYEHQYWAAVRADDVWAGLDYLLFDEAVNSGPLASIKDLQTALGVKADGQFGMITLSALQAVNDRAALLNKICDLRLSWLHRLKTWRVFGLGWTNRVAFARGNALRMI
jgi:lysozyme family protein